MNVFVLLHAGGVAGSINVNTNATAAANCCCGQKKRSFVSVWCAIEHAEWNLSPNVAMMCSFLLLLCTAAGKRYPQGSDTCYGLVAFDFRLERVLYR